MASYFRTMTRMAYLYPSLFSTEEDCLHHLFFVNGNGYQWVDGELLAFEDLPDPDPESPKTAPEQREFQATVRGLRESAHYALRLAKEIPDHLKRFNKLTKIAQREGYLGLGLFLKVEDAYEWHRPSARTLYPICEYAAIVNIPDDVKPDWLDAALRAYNWATGLKDVGAENERWLRQIGERIGQIDIERQRREK